MTYIIDENKFASLQTSVTDRHGNSILMGNIEAVKVDPDSNEWVLVVKDE